MKNKLTDLNNHLFAQLERLSDEELSAEGIDKEIKRTDAIVNVSIQIIDNAKLSLDAARLVAQHGSGDWEQLLPGIGGKHAKKLPDFSEDDVKDAKA